MDLEFHEAANEFPLLDNVDLNELAADIKANGLKMPIWTFEGKIVDGRNRYRACKIAGVEPAIKEMAGGNPFAFVWSLNGPRRDLDKGTKACIFLSLNEKSQAWERAAQRIKDEANAARAAAALGNQNAARKDDGPTLNLGENSGGYSVATTVSEEKPKAPKTHKARKAKAKNAGVSAATIQTAEQIRKNAPDLFELVCAKELTLKKALAELRKRNEAAKQEEARARHEADTATQKWMVTDAQAVVSCAALVTDPPYGILKEDWEPKSVGELGAFTREWATRWNECGADVALIFWSQRYLFEGREWFDAALSNFTFHQLLIWHYPNNKGPQSRLGFKQTWEPIYFYRRKGSNRQIGVGGGDWGAGLNDFDCHVAAVPQGNFNNENMKQHPAQKPINVFRWLINAVTSPGEMVCDPFCGSGSSGIAATQLGRRFHGIEINAGFLDLARSRLATYGHEGGAGE